MGKIDDQGQIGSVEGFNSALERIAVRTDSGAIDTVTPPGTVNTFELRETEASQMGLSYQAANGSSVKHYGGRVIKGLGDQRQ